MVSFSLNMYDGQVRYDVNAHIYIVTSGNNDTNPLIASKFNSQHRHTCKWKLSQKDTKRPPKLMSTLKTKQSDPCLGKKKNG